MTLEARAYIEKSDKVLYLVSDPALKKWIADANTQTEALDNLYFGSEHRADAYAAITDYIIKQLATPQHLCVALYGHPTVFSKPALDAALLARKQGIDVKILPGISAEACLFADLMIDPGTCGCQSFEATDFLLQQRKFDTRCHLILWQPDVIGLTKHASHANESGIEWLMQHLLTYYPRDHAIIIYQAAQYPGMQPAIAAVPLGELTSAAFSPICTIYVKPIV